MLFTLGMILFFRFFGRPIMKLALRYFIKKAQGDLNRQSQVYEQFVDGHSPFEDSVYVDAETRVSMRKDAKDKEKDKEKVVIDETIIETVDFEDID